jgi:hypothetical protein
MKEIKFVSEKNRGWEKSRPFSVESTVCPAASFGGPDRLGKTAGPTEIQPQSINLFS